MPTDSDTSYVKELRSIRMRYDLPTAMDSHLRDIIEQASDDPTPATNANQTATRIQQLLTYLMEDYRDTYSDAEAVRDELVDLYGSLIESDSTQ